VAVCPSRAWFHAGDDEEIEVGSSEIFSIPVVADFTQIPSGPPLKRIGSKDVLNFLSCLKKRRIPVGILLSALFGRQCPSDILKSNLTKWKKTSAAMDLVNDIPYTACLKRVIADIVAGQ
jgi:hypothetical protein